MRRLRGAPLTARQVCGGPAECKTGLMGHFSPQALLCYNSSLYSRAYHNTLANSLLTLSGTVCACVCARVRVNVLQRAWVKANDACPSFHPSIPSCPVSVHDARLSRWPHGFSGALVWTGLQTVVRPVRRLSHLQRGAARVDGLIRQRSPAGGAFTTRPAQAGDELSRAGRRWPGR